MKQKENQIKCPEGLKQHQAQYHHKREGFLCTKYKYKHEQCLSECFPFKTYFPFWWLKRDMSEAVTSDGVLLSFGSQWWWWESRCPRADQVDYSA